MLKGYEHSKNCLKVKKFFTKSADDIGQLYLKSEKELVPLLARLYDLKRNNRKCSFRCFVNNLSPGICVDCTTITFLQKRGAYR